MIRVIFPRQMAIGLSAVGLCALVASASGSFATAPTRLDLPRPQTIELCRDARSVLKAALIDRAGAQDVLSQDPPKFVFEPATPVVGIRRMTPFGPESNAWRIGWEGEPPRPSLVQRWYRLPYGSIANCFDFEGREEQLAKILGEVVGQFTPIDGPTPSIIRANYPAFDPSKTHALLLVSRFFRRQFGGSLELISLTRTKAGWKKTGSRVLGQS